MSSKNLYQKFMLHVIKAFIFLVIFLFPMNISAQGVDIENEFIQGCTEYQSGQFEKALHHFEIVLDFIEQSPAHIISNDDLLSLYIISGTCAKVLGNFNQSLNYCNKALVLENIPDEYLIILLNSKLEVCDELLLEDECLETEKKLLNLYSAYKDIEIVQRLTCYYLIHSKYENIIQFEPDLLDLKTKGDSEINLLANKIAMENIFTAMGKSFLELSVYDKALKYFFMTLNYLTDFTEKNRSIIYANISNIYDKIGDRENSLKYQRLAIDCE